MTNIRPEITNSKWKLPRHEFMTAYHFALQYTELKDRYSTLGNLNAIPLDDMPKGVSLSNPTESRGITAADISRKIEIIEEVVEDTVSTEERNLYPYILKAVTNEGITFNYLKLVMDMPIGKNKYYELRRKFYYLLSKKL